MLRIAPLPVRSRGSYTMAPETAIPKPLGPFGSGMHGFRGELDDRIPLAGGTGIHQVRAKLAWPAEIDHAGGAETGDAVAVGGKRAPGLGLAGSKLADLGIVDEVRPAEPGRDALRGRCKQNDQERKRESTCGHADPGQVPHARRSLHERTAQSRPFDSQCCWNVFGL